MEINEKQFISGFNSGYLLAKYEPQMLTALFNYIQPMNSYISGLSYGQKVFELEEIKNHLNELGQIRLKVRDEKNRDSDL